MHFRTPIDFCTSTLARWAGEVTRRSFSMLTNSSAPWHWLILQTRADDKRAALERAADLYRADLLPSCYDEWISAERDRLRQRHRQALVRLVDLLEARRDYAQAIHHAQRLVRDEPADEDAYRRLMRLLALNGDRTGVMRAYQSCVANLQRELDVEPSQTTREVYEGMLRMESRPRRVAERQPVLETTFPLVGRTREWERLHAAWLQAIEGPPGFVLVTGEAGIGKSRLAEELLSLADDQGITVARTRSYAAEGQLSLAPAADWLRSDVLRRNLAKLDPVWRTEVSRILPELVSEYPELPPFEPITEYGHRQRFFEALARAVLAAPQPLLLLIDDLQWCDQETLEWLHFLLRFGRENKMLILGTARWEEVPPQHPLRSLLLHLRTTVQVTELTLQPFDAAETAKLAAQVAGRDLDVEAVMRLYRETEGNPLFVVETVRSQGGGSFRKRRRWTVGCFRTGSSHPQQSPGDHFGPPGAIVCARSGIGISGGGHWTRFHSRSADSSRSHGRRKYCPRARGTLSEAHRAGAFSEQL